MFLSKSFLAASLFLGLSQGKLTSLKGTSFGLLGNNETFDYVVVGGGTAGLTIAKRLAENSSVSVAVVEAGGFYELDNGNISQIPADAVDYSSPVVVNGHPLQPQPLIDWSFITKPQTQLDNRLIHYTQGKTLGGGSARNYLAYHRPTVGTFDMWASRVGDESFRFNSVFPYYEKSVAFTPPNAAKIGPLAALIEYTNASIAGGPLHVSYPNYLHATTSFFYRALEALGLQEIAGLNNGKLLGFACVTSTIDPADETRSSSQTSFLNSALGYPNLVVYHNTIANKILFNGTTASGVNITTAGISYVLSAKKEVIVSAGVFKSPQLLMLSGVGPRDTLEQFQIPVVSELAGVGQELWDQPFFSATYKVNVTTTSALSDPQVLAAATNQYLTNQSGPLTSAGGDFIGWEKLPSHLRKNLTNSDLAALAAFPSDWPELELLPFSAPFAAVTDDAMYASSTIALLTFTSRGNVTISSSDVNDQPIINPNWLATETDQRLAVQGLKRARELAAASGIVVSEYAPGSNVTSYADLLEYLRQTTGPIHHAAATCKMGMANDTMAVVDSRAKVFGVSRLRVVDASAFPFVPPGHIQSSVYMLAEKIADDIKKGK